MADNIDPRLWNVCDEDGNVVFTMPQFNAIDQRPRNITVIPSDHKGHMLLIREHNAYDDEEDPWSFPCASYIEEKGDMGADWEDKARACLLDATGLTSNLVTRALLHVGTAYVSEVYVAFIDNLDRIISKPSKNSKRKLKLDYKMASTRELIELANTYRFDPGTYSYYNGTSILHLGRTIRDPDLTELPAFVLNLP